MKKTFRTSDARPNEPRDVRDEIEFHLAMRTKEFIEQGLAPDAARKAARASFGDVETIESALADERSARQRTLDRREWFSSVREDIRLSLRALRRRPLFAASTIGALALGIGATGAVFAVVNGVLLRPLPYSAPDQLAMIWLRAPENRGGSQWPLSAGFFDQFRRENRTFQSIAAFRSWPGTLGDFEVTERVDAARVTPSLFSTLGIKPFLGRDFIEAEGQTGGPRVAILGHALWQRRFGSDRSVLGRTITLSGEKFEVVGIMPAGFSFPRGAELMRGLQFPPNTELWTPLVFTEQDLKNGAENLAAVGRLAPGSTPSQAHDDIQTLVTATLTAAGVQMEIGNEVVLLKDQAARPVQRGLLLLLSAVVVVLLIACANVAALLSARVHARRRELAVRMALGARQGRVGRQLLTEMLVLASVGGVVGALCTWGGTRLLRALLPADLPRTDDIGVGLSVLAAVGIVALLCGLAFGVIVRRNSRANDAVDALRASTRSSDSRGVRAGRRMLVTAQVALSVMLLVGAGLLLRSFVRIQQVRPGFVADQAIIGDVDIPRAGVFDFQRDGPEWIRFFDTFLARVSQLRGVVAVGAASGIPLTGSAEWSSFVIVGREPDRPENAPRMAYIVAAGDYFRAAGIALLQGRGFEERDRTDAPRVVIISKSLADAHFKSENPIGRQIRTGFEFNPNAGPRQIIGVVDDVKLGSLDDDVQPTVYVPESQMPYPGLRLVVRTSEAPETILPAIRRALRETNPAVALSDVRTLADVLRQSLARRRFTLTLIGSFATAALLLAVLGLYGVIAMSVQARRHELGVRLALGARPSALVRLVLREGMQLAGVGVVLGLTGAFVAAGALRALLYGVSERDAGVFAVAAALVIAVALIASWVPARRATRQDPTEALRVE